MTWDKSKKEQSPRGYRSSLRGHRPRPRPRTPRSPPPPLAVIAPTSSTRGLSAPSLEETAALRPCHCRRPAPQLPARGNGAQSLPAPSPSLLAARPAESSKKPWPLPLCPHPRPCPCCQVAQLPHAAQLGSSPRRRPRRWECASRCGHRASSTSQLGADQGDPTARRPSLAID